MQLIAEASRAPAIPLWRWLFSVDAGTAIINGFFTASNAQEAGGVVGADFTATITAGTPKSFRDLYGSALPAGADGFEGTVTFAGGATVLYYFKANTWDGTTITKVPPSSWPNCPTFGGGTLLVGRVSV